MSVLHSSRGFAARYGGSMSKDTMISFRTTEEFSKPLKKLAKKNKTTLSGFIDAVLQDFLQSQAGQEILMQDRRRFPRQHKTIPAIISPMSIM